MANKQKKDFKSAAKIVDSDDIFSPDERNEYLSSITPEPEEQEPIKGARRTSRRAPKAKDNSDKLTERMQLLVSKHTYETIDLLAGARACSMNNFINQAIAAYINTPENIELIEIMKKVRGINK